MECSIVNARTSFINLKVGGHLITTLCLLLAVRTCYAMFQAKNNIKSAPASSALTQSCTEAITCIPQIVTIALREKGKEYKGEQRYFLVNHDVSSGAEKAHLGTKRR